MLAIQQTQKKRPMISRRYRILFQNGGHDLLEPDVVMVLGGPTCLENRIIKAFERT